MCLVAFFLWAAYPMKFPIRAIAAWIGGKSSGTQGGSCYLSTSRISTGLQSLGTAHSCLVPIYPLLLDLWPMPSVGISFLRQQCSLCVCVWLTCMDRWWNCWCVWGQLLCFPLGAVALPCQIAGLPWEHLFGNCFPKEQKRCIKATGWPGGI